MRNTQIFNELSEHITLRINSFRDEFHGRDWIESKAHIDYDLWIILEGEVTIQTKDCRLVASVGDVVFFYPHIPYTASTNEEGCRFIYVHFHFGIGHQMQILEDFQFAGCIPNPLIQEEVAGFKQAFKEHQGLTSSASGLRLKGALMILLSRIIHAYSHDEYTGSFDVHPFGHVYNLVSLHPAFQYIHDQMHKPIKVIELANLIGMSEKYFITYFKKTLGITPGQYIYQLKMNKARDFLYQKNHSIKEIASLLGYPDPYSFSKAFKKYYHIPPSQFV